jgi:hypothetical protein
LKQRAEQGVRALHNTHFSVTHHSSCQAHFLRTYYPDVDIPAELIREQVGVETQLEDSLRVFDPLVGGLVTSFHVPNGSKKPRSFMAFPMGENGCDLSEGTSHLAGRWTNIVLDVSSIDFTAEGNIITEPSHYPVKTFETPIRQIVSSPVSSDLSKGIFPIFFWLDMFVTQNRNRGGSPDILVHTVIVTILVNYPTDKDISFRGDEGNRFYQQAEP